MAPYKGRKVVTYHRSWPNFCDRFGLEVVDYVEPQARHSADARPHARADQQDEAREIQLILVEPYFDLRTPNSIAARSAGTWRC